MFLTIIGTSNLRILRLYILKVTYFTSLKYKKPFTLYIFINDRYIFAIIKQITVTITNKAGSTHKQEYYFIYLFIET